MDIVTNEQLQSLANGAKSVGQVMIGTAQELVKEAINLFIIESCLQILKFSVVFVVYYIIKKYVEFLQSSGLNERMVRAMKVSALIISITFFTTQSMPHLTNMAKALVAPNIFLMEKGADYIAKLQGK